MGDSSDFDDEEKGHSRRKIFISGHLYNNIPQKIIVNSLRIIGVSQFVVQNLQIRNRCFKMRCDTRFQRAFTAFSSVFKEITLVGLNLGNYFKNATA